MLFAQAPQAFKYQAIVRNADGDIYSFKNVSIKISIHKGSANGTVVYSEKHLVNTLQFGSVSLIIGKGTVLSGSFSSIAWSTDSYFIESSIDSAAEDSYTSLGVAQLYSVPYALYAEKSGTNQPMDFKVYQSWFNKLLDSSFTNRTFPLVKTQYLDAVQIKTVNVAKVAGLQIYGLE